MKKILLSVLSIFLAITFAFPLFACDMFNKKDTVKELSLEKQAGEDFKILQLTDIQIIDPYHQPYYGRLSSSAYTIWADKNKCAFDLIKDLVIRTNPDYIVLTGDNVYGQFDPYGDNFKALVSLMESFKTPWSFVNGNHDGEYEIPDKNGNIVSCGKGLKWQGDYVKNNTKYCLYDLGDIEMGFGNYTVTLKENNKAVYSFSFFDSHGCEGYNGPGINKTQISWYESELKKIDDNANSKVPNFIFLHIPLREFSLAMEYLGFTDDIGVITKDGYPNTDGNFGKNAEHVSSFNSGVFWSKIQELGNTKGIFAGHDHVNNSSILYEGIRLTYGTKTGIYDYYDDSQQGGTLITIKDNGVFTVEPVYKA